MRVFLLQPNAWYDAHKGFKPPLGLASLAAYLRRAGHHVSAMDMSFPLGRAAARYLREDPRVVEAVRAAAPDVIGISCYTDLRFNAFFWARLLKQRLPGVTIVMGGPHVSILPEPTLNAHPEVDFVIRYEGEVAFAALLGALAGDRPLAEVPSLAYRDGDGQVRQTERAALVADLDTLPDPEMEVFPNAAEMMRHALPVDSRVDLFDGPVGHLVTSRGCPFKCRFCFTSHYWGGAVRFRSPERVVAEVRATLARWPFLRALAFHDDTFTLKRQHVTDICERLIEADLGIRWTCWSRLDVLDAELLATMKRAGCVHLKCGIESGTERGLSLVGKKLPLAEIPERVRLIKASGIVGSYTFIVGIPGETAAEALETVRLIRRLGVPREDLRVSWQTTILPGTAFGDDFEAERTTIDWDRPSAALLPTFTRDSEDNPIHPQVALPRAEVDRLQRALALPLPSESEADQRSFRRYAPYLHRQHLALRSLAGELERPARILCLHGASDEAVLALALEELEQTAVEVIELRADTELPVSAGSFAWVIDLNGLPAVPPERVPDLVDQILNLLTAGGAATFLWRNSRHLLARLRARLGRPTDPAQQSLASDVSALTQTLTARGFTSERRRGEGVEIPWRLATALPALVPVLRQLRCPAPVAYWNQITCTQARGTHR